MKRALPEKYPARPADVRKALGLPARLAARFGLRPICSGVAPHHCEPERKRKALPHIKRQKPRASITL